MATILIPPMGPLGAAAAVVTGDLLIQFGLLGIIVMRQTLERPFLHLAALAVLMACVTFGGWTLGAIIRASVPGTGPIRFITECALWLAVVVLAASPLASDRIRSRLIAGIPR
jgi:hypothetical protein